MSTSPNARPPVDARLVRNLKDRYGLDEAMSMSLLERASGLGPETAPLFAEWTRTGELRQFEYKGLSLTSLIQAGVNPVGALLAMDQYIHDPTILAPFLKFNDDGTAVPHFHHHQPGSAQTASEPSLWSPLTMEVLSNSLERLMEVIRPRRRSTLTWLADARSARTILGVLAVLRDDEQVAARLLELQSALDRLQDQAPVIADSSPTDDLRAVIEVIAVVHSALAVIRAEFRMRETHNSLATEGKVPPLGDGLRQV